MFQLVCMKLSLVKLTFVELICNPYLEIPLFIFLQETLFG